MRTGFSFCSRALSNLITKVFIAASDSGIVACFSVSVVSNTTVGLRHGAIRWFVLHCWLASNRRGLNHLSYWKMKEFLQETQMKETVDQMSICSMTFKKVKTFHRCLLNARGAQKKVYQILGRIDEVHLLKEKRPKATKSRVRALLTRCGHWDSRRSINLLYWERTCP